MVQVEPVAAGRDAGVEFGRRRGDPGGLERLVVLGQEHDLGHADQELDAGQFQVVPRQADSPGTGLAQQLSVGE